MLMPIVPVLNYTNAKLNGMKVNGCCSNRGSKLYKETNDITAKPTHHTKVCNYYV